MAEIISNALSYSYNDIMSWHPDGLHKIGPQNIHELHISHVYSDPEFVDDIHRIFPERDEYVEARSNKKKTRADTLYAKLKSIDDIQWIELSKKYAITSDDLWWYINGNNLQQGNFGTRHRKPFETVKITDRGIVLAFSLDITKEDYLEAWSQLVVPQKQLHHGGRNTKIKLPEHDILLYAIFKARKRGETFKGIFQQYENGKLPYYTGTNKMFNHDQDKFEEYYRKYKPFVGKDLPPR